MGIVMGQETSGPWGSERLFQASIDWQIPDVYQFFLFSVLYTPWLILLHSCEKFLKTEEPNMSSSVPLIAPCIQFYILKSLGKQTIVLYFEDYELVWV